MRTAVVIVSMIAVVVAEAPYHSPRPAAHAPSFNYQAGLARQQPAQANFASSGYNYQQPSIQPAFAPQPQHHHHHHHHQAAPHFHQPAPQQHFHAQPAPQANFNSGYNYQQPSIQPAYIPPQPVFQQAPQPSIPSTSYGVPQPQIARPLPALQPQQVYLPQPQIAPAPAPAPVQVYQPAFQQQSSQQGYAYSQPAQFQQSAPAPQFAAQSFSSGSSGVSSYQADSAQYSGVHGEALDSVVVNRLQNIIKESEHSAARDSGYQSLVSGISLEGARPSVELSSFVQTGPVASGGASFGSQGSSFSSQGSSSAESIAVSAPGPSYGLPSISANSQSSSSGSVGFLPSARPAAAYGPPN